MKKKSGEVSFDAKVHGVSYTPNIPKKERCSSPNGIANTLCRGLTPMYDTH